MSVVVGLSGEARVVVDDTQTAEAVGASGVRVFGTPAMIALMEIAAWRALEPALEPGETTVGTLVNVRHLAATPIGESVVATAELIEIDERRLVFRVSARDAKRLVGEGIHERARVQLDRFLARLSESR